MKHLASRCVCCQTDTHRTSLKIEDKQTLHLFARLIKIPNKQVSPVVWLPSINEHVMKVYNTCCVTDVYCHLKPRKNRRLQLQCLWQQSTNTLLTLSQLRINYQKLLIFIGIRIQGLGVNVWEEDWSILIQVVLSNIFETEIVTCKIYRVFYYFSFALSFSYILGLTDYGNVTITSFRLLLSRFLSKSLTSTHTPVYCQSPENKSLLEHAHRLAGLLCKQQ